MIHLDFSHDVTSDGPSPQMVRTDERIIAVVEVGRHCHTMRGTYSAACLLDLLVAHGCIGIW